MLAAITAAIVIGTRHFPARLDAITVLMRLMRMAATRQDAINDALERLYDLGFTMENSFSEHGPMVAEALSTLGRGDAVPRWVETYKAKHDHAPPPPRKEPIDGKNERRSAITREQRTGWSSFGRS